MATTVGNFSDAGQRIIHRAITGMATMARVIMTESLVECPVDTTTLRRSAKIEPVIETGTELSVTFGYGYGGGVNPKTGRMAADYAVPVHEIVEHYHEPPTKSHFLLDPVMANAPLYKYALMGAIRLDVPNKPELSSSYGLAFSGEELLIQ